MNTNTIQIKEKILEIKQWLPKGGQKQVQEITGYSWGTVNKVFNGGKVTEVAAQRIIAAAVKVAMANRKEHEEAKNLLENF